MFNIHCSMDWHQHFKETFFGTWRKAGLPGNEAFKLAAFDTTAFSSFNFDWVINAPNLPPGLQTYQLQSVYGFGVMVGVMFSRMLGLDTTQTKLAVDWCGRFNLGISLFDYISDELGGAKRVESLSVFKSFSFVADAANENETPAETLLGKLAVSVLADLDKSRSNKKKSLKNDPLFKTLHQLFEAENFISNERVSATADLKKINKALYLKSAAPFLVMAEYCARMADSNDPVLIKKARTIGKAVGYCYWVIDDAKDVWIDLEAGQWNLFLQLAARTDPKVFANPPNECTRATLQGIWIKAGHAQKISTRVKTLVVNAIPTQGLPVEGEPGILGFLSASMWQWYTS